MKLFILDYWVSYPRSEYGGMIVVIAKDFAEVRSILLSDPDFDYVNYVNADREFERSIKNARVYELSGKYPSGILARFIT